MDEVGLPLVLTNTELVNLFCATSFSPHNLNFNPSKEMEKSCLLLTSEQCLQHLPMKSFCDFTAIGILY